MKYTIQETILKNSARMLSVHVPGASTFYMQVFFRSGSLYAPKDKYELAHLMEHLAFMGNKKIPSKQDFAFEIEKNGAYMNAHTSSEILSYDYVCAMHESNTIIDLALAQIFQPLMPIEAIESEKKVIVSELKRKQNNDRFKRSYDGIYRNTYADIQSIEERIASLKNINREDVVSFHKAFHAPANMCVVLSGDLPKEKLAEISRLFVQAAPVDITKKLQARKNTLKKDYKQKVVLQAGTEKDQSFFSFNLINPVYYPEKEAALHILNAMYTQGDFSRMFLTAREQGLSYGVGSSYGVLPEATTYEVNDQTEPEKLNKLFKLCLRELKSILDGEFSEKEFERAKGYVIGRMSRHYELAQEVADFSEGYYLYEDWKIFSPQDAITELEKVQPSDISELRELLLQDNNWILSIVGSDLDGKEDFYTKMIQKELFS